MSAAIAAHSILLFMIYHFSAMPIHFHRTYWESVVLFSQEITTDPWVFMLVLVQGLTICCSSIAIITLDRAKILKRFIYASIFQFALVLRC